jgi:RecJ-like exonuclease
MLLESEEIIRKYRSNLRTYMNTLVAEKWRIIEEGHCVFVNGDGLIPEEMLGAVSSLLSGSASYSSRLVFVKAQTRDEMSYKFSSRRGLDLDSDINLGQILRESATSVEGTGGGHSAAAGCRIPFGALDQFLATLKRHILENRIAIQS